MVGVSQPGFHVAASIINSHPALKAASPQAPTADYYMGDDVYHNGAFMLGANFGFYSSFVPRTDGPTPPKPALRFDPGTPDMYDFFLHAPPLTRMNQELFGGNATYWQEIVDHTIYDDFWKKRSLWKFMDGVKCAVLNVGGWFDAEDPMGPLRTYRAVEQKNPGTPNMLVMGPWSHGGWGRGPGEKLGQPRFRRQDRRGVPRSDAVPVLHEVSEGQGGGPAGSLDVSDRRERMAAPRRLAAERCHADNAVPRRERRALDVRAGGRRLRRIRQRSEPAGAVCRVHRGRHDGRLHDRRSALRVAASRRAGLPDRAARRGHDRRRPVHRASERVHDRHRLRLRGQARGCLPGRLPVAAAARGQRPPSNAIKMGGYQQLVRGEPFRGKFRNSFEKPEPLRARTAGRRSSTICPTSITHSAGGTASWCRSRVRGSRWWTGTRRSSWRSRKPRPRTSRRRPNASTGRDRRLPCSWKASSGDSHCRPHRSNGGTEEQRVGSGEHWRRWPGRGDSRCGPHRSDGGTEEQRVGSGEHRRRGPGRGDSRCGPHRSNGGTEEQRVGSGSSPAAVAGSWRQPLWASQE